MPHTWLAHLRAPATAALLLAAPVGYAAGSTLESEEGDFTLELGGRLMLDGDSFDGVLNLPNDGDRRFNGQIRRSRLELGGDLPGRFDWQFDVDYVDATHETEIHTAGLRYAGWSVANVLVGRTKEPFGLEELTSSKAISTMRRNFIAEATDADSQPYYGVRLDGFVGPVGWSAGIFNPNGNPRNADGGDRLAFTGRVFGTPIQQVERVLHLGAAFSDRNLDDPEPVQAFGLRVAESGDRVDPERFLARQDRQFGLEALYLDGPFSLQGEAFWRDLHGADPDPDASVDSQYLQATWTVTGESRGYKASEGVPGMVKPSSRRGAWELVVKAERLALDADGRAGRRACAYTAGANYYANEYVRFMLNITQVETTNVAPAGQDDDALVVSGRVQLAF